MCTGECKKSFRHFTSSPRWKSRKTRAEGTLDITENGAGSLMKLSEYCLIPGLLDFCLTSTVSCWVFWYSQPQTSQLRKGLLSMWATCISSSFTEIRKFRTKCFSELETVAVMELGGKDDHWNPRSTNDWRAVSLGQGKRQFVITARSLFFFHGCQEAETFTEDVSILWAEKGI